MDFCLWQGIPQVYNDISQGHLSITTSIHMPLVYVVSPNGRTGAELRVARGTHELKATGQCARLGALLLKPRYGFVKWKRQMGGQFRGILYKYESRCARIKGHRDIHAIP